MAQAVKERNNSKRMLKDRRLLAEHIMFISTQIDKETS
jgi:hypothetical protein